MNPLESDRILLRAIDDEDLTRLVTWSQDPAVARLLNSSPLRPRPAAFNERAMKTYKNAGFVEEGRSRQNLFRDGVWHDTVHMGILASEWRKP